jgi:hypothetical protein
MYKSTHSHMQNHADARNPFNFAQGDQLLTEDQKRENLKLKIAATDKRLAEMPQNHPQRKVLGQEKATAQMQLAGIGKKDTIFGAEHFFIRAAKDVLSVGQYNIVMKAAVQMMKKYQEAELGKEFKSTKEMPKAMKEDLEDAIRQYTAKGGSVEIIPEGKRKYTSDGWDSQLSLLTVEQRKICKKLRSCGISKDDALQEAKKP